MKKQLFYFTLLLSLFTFASHAQFAVIPSVQCSNATISSITTSSFKVSWTAGSGAYTFVVIKPSSSTKVTPSNTMVDNATASTVYASGTNLGSNNYVVYKGSSSVTNITITGMASNSDFDVYCYSYNYSSIPPFGSVYAINNTVTITNNTGHYTLATEPTTTPTIALSGTAGANTATLSVGGTGSNYRLISVRKSGVTGLNPVDAIYYAGSTTWGSGNEVGGTGSQNYAVQSHNLATTVNVSNLTPGTAYYARVYAYNGQGTIANNSFNYRATYADVYFHTYNNAPTMNTIADQTVCVNAPTQTISLSGISDGSAAETQTVSIYAYSGNSSLISSAYVNYTNPNTTGQLIYTPVAAQTGTCVIYVYVYDNGSSNNYATKSFTVTVNPKPSAATAISTPTTTLCRYKDGVPFTVGAIANATSYVWNLPTGATIATGAGTNSVTVDFAMSSNSETIWVKGANTFGCGYGDSSSIKLYFDRRPTVSNAGTDQQICSNTALLAANTPSSGIALWTLIQGSAVISTPGNPATSVTGIANNQTVKLVWNIANGVCPVSKDTVTVTNIFGSPSCNPDAEFSASTTTACVNSALTFYDASIGATSYTWNFGSTATPSTATTAGPHNVTYSTIGAKTVTLTINSINGLNSEIKSGYINVINTPVAPGSISGNTTLCQNSTNQAYFISTVTNATDYNWSFPTGGSLNTGGTTNAITADFDNTAVSGNISVTASNQCGTSAASTLSVTVNPLPTQASVITGSATVCQNQSNLTYIASGLNNGLSYTWTLPVGASLVTGINTKTITVSYDNTSVTGDIEVYGTNGCGNGQLQTLEVTVNPLPSSASTIYGNSTVETCPLTTGTNYSLAPVSNATDYIWSLPNGFTIVGGANTNSITVDASLVAQSGNITVTPQNSCGNGTSSLLPITVNGLPTQELCSVTVDESSTFNEITWEKNNVLNVDSFRVYKMTSINTDVLVGTVFVNDLSTFQDLTASPNAKSEQYRIAALDACGNEGAKSAIHETMFMTLTSGVNSIPTNVELSWNNYFGQTVSLYRILADTNNLNTWFQIDTKPPQIGGGNNTYVFDMATWTNYNSITNVNFRVAIDWLTPCDNNKNISAFVNSTKSNTKTAFIVPTDVSVLQNTLNQVTVYPNPTHTTLTVEATNVLSNVEVTLVNTLGQTVKQHLFTNSTKTNFDVSNLESGYYYIHLKHVSGYTITKSFIKN